MTKRTFIFAITINDEKAADKRAKASVLCATASIRVASQILTYREML
jgi:hypothetical protein